MTLPVACTCIELEDRPITVFGRTVNSPRRCEYCVQQALESLRRQQIERRTRRIDGFIENEHGIPMMYRQDRWGDYDAAPEVQATIRDLKNWSDNFPGGIPHGYKSLIISGQNHGTGKTMVTCLMLKDIIKHYRGEEEETSPYQFWNAADLRHEAQASMRFGSKASLSELYHTLGNLSLLVIDDVGREQQGERDAEFVASMYYTIINRRYNQHLPLVLTTNLSSVGSEAGSLESLIGKAALTRLMQMAGREHVVDGVNRRLQNLTQG